MIDPIGVSSSKDSGEPGQTAVNSEILELIADAGQILVCGLLLDFLLFEGTEVVGIIRLGATAALLVGVLKSQGWLVLLALQASLFMREPRRPEMMLGLIPLLYGLTSICIIAYAYLGKPFRNRFSRWLVMQVLFALGTGERTVSDPSQSKEPSSNWIQLVAVQFAVWLLITLVAMFTLIRSPISAAVRSEWLRNAIENDFTVWPGATLLVLTLLLVIVFMEAGWRQMSRAQARLYLHSSFVLEHYRDLKMIVLRRLKKASIPAIVGSPPKQLVERAADAPPKFLK